MLSLKKSTNSNTGAIIISPNREIDAKLVYVDASSRKGSNMLRLDGDDSFMIFPSKTPERLYISAKTGAGKSYISAKYAEYYNMIYPKNKVVMFSPHADDPAYKDVINMLRLDLNDEALYEKEFDDVSKFSNKLIIFDDVDSLADSRKRKFIEALQKELIQNSRRYGTYILSLSHMMMDGNRTRHLISEANRVIFFPNMGSTFHIKRFLKVYAGVSPSEIENILRNKSRWMCINMDAPTYILSSNVMYTINKT